MEGIFSLIKIPLRVFILLTTEQPIMAIVIVVMVATWYVLTRPLMRKKTGKTLPQLVLSLANPRSPEYPIWVIAFYAFEFFLVVLGSIRIAVEIGFIPDLFRIISAK